MKNFYYCHICLKPIDLEISKLNFRVQSISLVVVADGNDGNSTKVSCCLFKKKSRSKMVVVLWYTYVQGVK